jgi:hypothetical protein
MSPDEELIEDFQRMHDAWLMEFHTGWWAFYGDERPLGPFDTKADASRAGLEALARVIKKSR